MIRRRSRGLRRFRAGFALLLVALVAPAAVAEPGWKLEQVESRLTQFAGVWGSSAEDVFAVGARGVIVRFDGSRWRRQRSGTSRHLASVWAASPSFAVAVGLDGTILHFDGRGWEKVESGTSKTLVAVWGVSPADVFAVGRDGTILHFDGRAWTRQPSGTAKDLNAVWGSSPSDVWAAGAHGTLLRYDGTGWKSRHPSFGWHWTFTALGGSSPENVVAVGVRRPSGSLGDSAEEGFALRYDGETWEPIRGGETQIVAGLWPVARDEAYFVGPALNGLEEVRLHDGAQFRTVDSQRRFSPRAIWAARTGEIFVVGTNGFVLSGRVR